MPLHGQRLLHAPLEHRNSAVSDAELDTISIHAHVNAHLYIYIYIYVYMHAARTISSHLESELSPLPVWAGVSLIYEQGLLLIAHTSTHFLSNS